MKLIVAIIQPHKLEEVKSELTKNEINRLTVSDVQGTDSKRENRKLQRSRIPSKPFENGSSRNRSKRRIRKTYGRRYSKSSKNRRW